ncbi:MAG: ZIP family metal transporter [Patescibacteria group bacterium]
MIWSYTLASVFLVSLLSLAGASFLLFQKERVAKMMIYLVSLSAGTLLGDAFIHLIPESFEIFENSLQVSLLILSGILLFFLLEKIIHWRHCHEVASDNHPHPFSYMILLGDTLHNFIDGMIIAGSFLVSVPLGIATTIAVIFHEIPQEIGDFGSLIYGGFSRLRALALNLLSAFSAVLGAILVLVFGQMESLGNALIPFAAGGFIYIASTDLIPELKKHVDAKRSFLQVGFFIAGIGIMLLLTFSE